MTNPFSAEERKEFLKRGFTRRSFGRMATLVTAGATLPFYNEFALAQQAQRRMMPRFEIPPDAVLINANENPLGPCAEALEAIYSVAKKCGRYMWQETGAFQQTSAQVAGLKPDYVTPYAGSSDPLHRTVLAFCSPTKGFVMGDPGYEAGGRAAEFIGAKITRVPLRKDYSHDVQEMVKADPNAGVIYICNPNNPSGTLTSRADIEYLLANKPAGSILLLDEAYIHFSNAASGSELVAADKDLIVLRTFSKAYGMAGLRAGLAMGRPDLLAKLGPWGAGMMPATGMAGATASMKVANLVSERRRINKEIREDVLSFLTEHNISFIPSESNKFMMDVKRPGMEFAKAMMAEKVFVGRVWKIWPNHVRVTVGLREEMEKFKQAVLKVMA